MNDASVIIALIAGCLLGGVVVWLWVRGKIHQVADQAKGKVKEWVGKATGDTKTHAEGKMDQIKGKAENAVGGVKDAIRDKNEHHD